ncbi:uncharacterized protein LOC105917517 [Fundulus heteroclitus]|uniref:uncharacterized protein LOC105917517 n=1 Tax=Fundulus heteroclitus TaxID=8078 RepID=UPI00165B2D1C|nr:uncharacterized protein LOC105917517 [Fundulus heteroclitus]
MSSVDSGFVHPEVSACTSVQEDAFREDAFREHGNACKKRASYFTALERRVLLQAYEEHGDIFREKSNKAAASKAREAAWKKIAARVNECNSGEKRTWKQLKMKYKNIMKANRKQTGTHKINGELLIPPLTEAEGLAISQWSPGPVSEGLSGDASPEPGTDAAVHKVEPPAAATGKKPGIKEEAPRKDAKIHTDRMAGHRLDWVPSASTAHLDTLPVNELYRHHLLKTIEKTDKEITYLDRQIKKADLEILLLERQLRE